MCTSTAEPFVVIEITRQVIMCTLRELLAEDRNYLVAVHGHFRFMRRLLYVQTYMCFWSSKTAEFVCYHEHTWIEFSGLQRHQNVVVVILTSVVNVKLMCLINC